MPLGRSTSWWRLVLLGALTATAGCAPVGRGTAEGIGGGDPVLGSLRAQRAQLALAADGIAQDVAMDLCSVAAIVRARPDFFDSYPHPSGETVALCRNFFSRYASRLAQLAHDESASPIQLVDEPVGAVVNGLVTDVLANSPLGTAGIIHFFYPRLWNLPAPAQATAVAHELLHQLPTDWDPSANRFVDGGAGLRDENGIANYPSLATDLFAVAWYAEAYKLVLDDDALGDLYDFGGAYGYHGPSFGSIPVDFAGGILYPNPTTNSASCPPGYQAFRVLGNLPNSIVGPDWPVFYCMRPHLDGRDPDYDFGGMWGRSTRAPYSNPATGSQSCPDGYESFVVAYTQGVDDPFHVCYRKHVHGRKAALRFGGMIGTYATPDGGIGWYRNPATNGTVCPDGYQSSLVHGTSGLDWAAYLCH